MTCIDLYPESSRPFSPEAFLNPPAAYRAHPFLALNGALNAERIRAHIADFHHMGMGGFHLHARVGLSTPYLGSEWMEVVRQAIDEAQGCGMLAWLYDEDCWPSGSAGGLVTTQECFRQRNLVFGTQAPPSGAIVLAYYRIELDAKGFLKQAIRLSEPATGVWTVWEKIDQGIGNGQANCQAYVDTLQPAAIDRFLELTHNGYQRAIGESFGKTVPAIFFDEPHMPGTRTLDRPESSGPAVLPWTFGGLDGLYQQTWNEDFWEILPDLIWDRADGRHLRSRWRWRDLLAERFRQVFSKRLGDSARSLGLLLTGHYHGEERLEQQGQTCGEVMRQYREEDIPGVDLLLDAYEPLIIKQAASIAHQDGRIGVMSELAGVTNWDFPLRGHKRHADWQMALGVTVRVPHLSWYSMAGVAKRDYPASFDRRLPWWERFTVLEEHCSRVCLALTRGRPVVNVALIHPIESRWLHYGPNSQHHDAAWNQDQDLHMLVKGLLESLIDFDFICESQLPEQQTKPSTDGFAVGKMRYQAVLVPPMLTIRSSTLEKLRTFRAAGGLVLFMGAPPALVDAVPSDAAKRLAADCQIIGSDLGSLIPAIDHLRDFSIEKEDGAPSPRWPIYDRQDLVYQLRAEGEERWLFVCCHRREDCKHEDALISLERLRLRIKGRWNVRELNTAKGEELPLPYSHDAEETLVPWIRSSGGHLLLRLSPAKQSATNPLPVQARFTEVQHLACGMQIPITLNEPNVLLLDQAKWRLNGGPWQQKEELQRIDIQARRLLGWPNRQGSVLQPWVQAPSGRRAHIDMSFTIDCGVNSGPVHLALERIADAKIILDGIPITVQADGHWVDPCLATVPLGNLPAGVHTLEISCSITPEADTVEWCYLLGDFGVQILGNSARLVAPVRSLLWGDWTTQGLPFYAANVTYHLDCDLPEGAKTLRIPHLPNPIVDVLTAGRRIGSIWREPYRLDLDGLTAGNYRLDLICYGSRINALGAVHNADPRWHWWGPNAWQTTGGGFSYEYQLRRQGILTAPRLERRG